jgi:glycerol 3-phosphatase-2
MAVVASNLQGTDRPLAEIHDVALLDLDGVVYVGPDAVPGAPQALAGARDAGMRLAFVTNNAARPPYVVSDHLTSLGIAAESSEVITSAQAAARYLADRLPGGGHVLVVGTTGLEVALRERGLVPVSDASGSVDAVVQGYSPTLDWNLLAEGAVAINSGVLWVATNVDPTVPSPRGPLPGNGSLVAALKLATRRDPVVTGKPDPTMHRETMLRTEAKTPLVVGDRLDTDIEGANAVGCPSLLVFSGVTTPADVIGAAPAHRPSYLGKDVGGLLDAQPEPTAYEGGWVCGPWLARRQDDVVSLEPSGSAAAGADEGGPTPFGPEDIDAVRALCAAAWAGSDSSTAPQTVRCRAAGSGDDARRSAATLVRLGLLDPTHDDGSGGPDTA